MAKKMRKIGTALVASLLLSTYTLSFISLSAFAADEEALSPEANQAVKKLALPAAGTMPAVQADESAGASSSAGSVSKPAVPKTQTSTQSNFANGSQQTEKLVIPRSSVAISSPVAPAVYKGAQTVAHETILPNGLKVLVLENHEFPVVSTLVWYRVGSRDEQTGSTGLSHMVEHLMFQEVGPFKPGDIGSSIARVGGQFNGYTSDDFTTFFETLPANKLEMALKIESERMAHTRFSDSEVKQEVANIQKEFENESKDPVALLSKEVRAMVFMQHPYHNPTIGWKTDVEALTAEHAKAFYEKFYAPSNATLIVSGDVNSKTVSTLVQKYFSGIGGTPKAVTHVTVNEPLPRSERRVNTKYSGNKEVLQAAYRAPAMDDPDAPAMVVLERLMNGGVNGRLKGKLIDGKICASAQASYELTKDPGLFTVTCTALPATYNAQAKILENVDSVMAQVREKAPQDAELKRAKNQAEFAYFAECDGPYRAGFHLGYFDCLDKWQNSYTWADRIRAVSAADVNRVAKKYFSPDARVVGWIAGATAPKGLPPKANNVEAPKEHEKQPNTKIVEHARLTGYKDSDSDASPNQTKTAGKKGIPAVIRDIPSALGNAVTGNLPGAVGNVGSAIINLPGAIGNLGTAVGNTATAIGKQIVQLKPGPESEAGNLSHRVLKNGINVIVFESHVSPVVQISGSVQAGDAYSTRNNPGFSLLAASILSQGSSKHSRAQMVSMQDDAGVAAGHMLKFESGIETIDFSTRCLSRDLPAHMEMIAETLSQPVLDDSNLDKSKLDALSTLKRTEEGVGQKVDRVLMQGLLDENSPFCPADPNDKSKAISQADLTETQKFFANHIVPGATTIVFAGDYNPEQVYTLAERAFGKWTGKGSHSQLHAKARAQHVLRSTLPIKDSKKSNICFGQIIPMAQSHPEYGSLLIADSILVNHPMFSRFEQALSKTPSLEAAISSGDMSVKLDPVSNMTRWSLSLSVEPSAVPLSVKTIKNELRLIARNGVTAEEFSEVKRYLLGSLPVRTQATLGAISSDLLDSAEHSDIVNGYGAEIASIKTATVETVNKVIRGAFKPELSTVVIAGGAQSIKAARNNSEAAASDNAAVSKNSEAETRTASPVRDTKSQERSTSDSKVKK